MTSGLRKTHKIMWMVLGLLGAVLIVLSINSVKEPLGIDNEIITSKTQKGAVPVENNAQLYASIEELATVNKLQIVIKKPLKSAATSVYTVDENQERSTFIGSIDNKGLYTFDIEKTVKKIQLYDGIKKSVIYNIDLSWE
ncbi:hypothetical protein [Dokdonia pacifica]|uniref:Uncharacterized protein n=1 Tax=Dokdonia pacifica TaxID=1627892 RepID=A0A238WSI0_9FLAO|nr:hypothetical protein [Dokdonia pacifica]SNR49487.1 hypothetical protein SAMN06265376_1011437 [Dokdonia pacifica]